MPEQPDSPPDSRSQEDAEIQIPDAPLEGAPVAQEPSTPAAAEPTAESGTEPATESAAEPVAEFAGEAVAESAADVEGESPDQDFGAMLEAAGDGVGGEPNVGNKVSGVVAQIREVDSFIDFGGRSEGVIKTTELNDEDGKLAFGIGDPLEAFVIDVGEGIQLSRVIGRENTKADLLYQAHKSGIPVQGKVTAINKWGLGVEVQGVRAFCPVAQIDTKFTKDTEEFRGQTMEFKIIRFSDQGRTVVLSRRALLEEAQKKEAVKLRAHIKVGAQLRGTVTRLESFGAFVDLGAGIEGLVHVSELRHDRVQHPSDVAELGQDIDVVVIGTKELGNIGKERISLSVKALEKDPWDEVKDQYKAGLVTVGKVESLEDYGAFVELAPNVRGMVHISEMADKRIAHPREVVSVGDEVKVAVVEVDSKRRRLRLSLKQAETLEDRTNLEEFQQRQQQVSEVEESGNSMMDALKRARLID